MQGTTGLSEYRTVARAGETELLISKSRFIGRCFPCASEEEARNHLERIRKQHWDASHNCFAFSIGRNGETARFSDDGEPSGTAGSPMMEAITRIGVTNAICVVTRYFGGILLGAGGLVRAYSKCCSLSIKAAGIIQMQPCSLYSFRASYPLWARTEELFKRYGTIANVDYSDCVDIRLWVPCKAEMKFIDELTRKTDAALKGEILRVDYAPVREEA